MRIRRQTHYRSPVQQDDESMVLYVNTGYISTIK